MEEVVNYGILSLIPAILAVGLAFWTKNVVLSLIISLFVGTLIIASWNPWIAMQDMFSSIYDTADGGQREAGAASGQSRPPSREEKADS